MDTPLRVFLTVDVGPDDAVLGEGHGTDARWTRTETGLAILRDELRSIEDRLGAPVRATWLLRADALIARQAGHRLSVFEQFERFTAERSVEGHEIGWMPQVYSSASEEVDYGDLVATHEALVAAGTVPASVRMGDCYHDNRTMEALDRLGIRIDSSAVPGREKKDSGWRMDWIGTPREAYHPSTADYRRPGEPRRKILEVPLSVMPIRAPYDAAPLDRYYNPCMRREFVDRGLRELLASRNDLVATMHPDEAVPGDAGHPLIAYSREELRHNLSELIEQARRLGRTVRFDVLRDFDSASKP